MEKICTICDKEIKETERPMVTVDGYMNIFWTHASCVKTFDYFEDIIHLNKHHEKTKEI